MTVAADDRTFLLYGGFNIDSIYSQIWQYNMYSNVWTKVNFGDVTHGDSISEMATPGAHKGDTMIRSPSGVFVSYGGATWQKSNLTFSDVE